MVKLSNKKNLSSIQVLRTLQVLLEGNYTMSEILDKLNDNQEGLVYFNATVSKYIHTLRYCGINIPKVNNKYIVASMPFGFELKLKDINLLEQMQNLIKDSMSSKYCKIFSNFIEKINRYSNQNIVNVSKKNYYMYAELFELAKKDKRKIRVFYKNRVVIDCIPLNIIENNGKTFFQIMYKNYEKMIDIGRISSIEILSEKFIKNFNDQVVVFELKDDLALRYNLRENESLIKTYDGKSITVANHDESKEILFSRLLRYDDKCEIIHPKIYREEMAQIINSALDNYGL